MTDDANRNASGSSRTPLLGTFPGDDAPRLSSDRPPRAIQPRTGGLIGRAFGNYIVDRLLTTGGMGEVYVLRHATLPGRWRVLKVILSSLSSNALVRDRFEREAHAVAQLGDHDNIVGIDDFGAMEDGQLWMIMPFVSGKPLDVHLAENGGRLPPYRVFELLCPIGLGVDHAHACGIVHRDLKPSNVFLTTTSNGAQTCKVLDFGIARQMNAQPGLPSTTQHMALGTPSYMAVEQYEFASDADVTADVYALACMVWEMVTGATPWVAEDPAVLYHKKLNELPGPPLGKAMPTAWEQILRSAVSVDKTKRPQSVRELVQALAAALPGSPPFVPSGLELLRKLTPKLEERAPDAWTLRKNPEAVVIRAAPVATAVQHTTLGSANGAVTVRSDGPEMRRSRPSRWQLAGLGVGATAVAMAITYVATVPRRGGTSAASGAGDAASRPAAAAHSTPTAPSAAPPAGAEPATGAPASAPASGKPAAAGTSAVPTSPSSSPPAPASAAPPPATVPAPPPLNPPASPATTGPATTRPTQPSTTAESHTRATTTLPARPTTTVTPASRVPMAHAKAHPPILDEHPPERTPDPSSQTVRVHKFDPNAVGGQEQ
jgi:serine/threonine protein kinase